MVCLKSLPKVKHYSASGNDFNHTTKTYKSEVGWQRTVNDIQKG